MIHGELKFVENVDFSTQCLSAMEKSWIGIGFSVYLIVLI